MNLLERNHNRRKRPPIRRLLSKRPTRSTRLKSRWANLPATEPKPGRQGIGPQRTIADHQMLNDKLKQLAEQKNVQISTQLDTMHQAMLDKLSNETGTTFDKQYVSDQVKGHQHAVALFQQATANNTDSNVKNYAETSVPTLQNHLQMAEQDQKTINEPAGAQQELRK